MRDVRLPNMTVVREHPDGGLFYLLPINGHELKKLAKQMVRFEYLLDGKGKPVFNQNGQPVPKFEQDDEAVIAEAMRRCICIDDVGVPVLDAAGNPVLDEDGKPKRERIVADDRTEPLAIGAHQIVPVEMKRSILCESYEYEQEIDSDAEAAEGAPKKVTRKVEQLVADWVIEECAKAGRAKREAAEKN